MSATIEAVAPTRVRPSVSLTRARVLQRIAAELDRQDSHILRLCGRGSRLDEIEALERTWEAGKAHYRHLRDLEAPPSFWRALAAASLQQLMDARYVREQEEASR